MTPDAIVAVSTLAFHGYGFERILERISVMGFSYVEPAMISSYYDEMNDSFFSVEQARKLRVLISTSGLRVIAISAHMDLGLQNSAEGFRRRMAFARELGAAYIHTNGTTWKNHASLMKNLESILPAAEADGLVITLENPGDGDDNIIGSGKEGSQFIAYVGSRCLRLNYDFSNAHSYSRGKLDIAKDFEFASPFVAHMHLKDMLPDGQDWLFVPVGTGVTDYRTIFRSILQQESLAPMSIELPVRYKRGADFKMIRDPSADPPPLEKICRMILDSKEYVLKQLGLSAFQ
jgi:sugar phosphate isomerase/epimerase